MFEIVKLLINNGAKYPPCPSPSIDAFDLRLPKQPRLESSVSPLRNACELRDACLIHLLCEKGGVLPEGEKEVGAAVSVLVSDRPFQSQKEGHCQEGAILEHWRLAESLLQQHGEIALSFPASVRPNQAPICGSGSWFFDLISLEEARGPSLLKVIRSSPLNELDRIVQMGTHGGKSGHTHVSSLGVAIRSKWEEGVTALLERGVDPNPVAPRVEAAAVAGPANRADRHDSNVGSRDSEESWGSRSSDAEESEGSRSSDSEESGGSWGMRSYGDLSVRAARRAVF
uniref:Uncharacterized protein n=1 Tax=Chromera velia CCMP2878 TaxID=1169474 RepID=A0A0G4F859_9ALVE|eukprot:Cvel_15731.t1-p1 / transcript=Cvel_15731.t1 / gene=Cvel_15731 / organism=Chromera_velia_CCMP2878 / gene_product=hypothetical protein / transcript_product=hypothetical protein / location=Cvel_scaffold1176:44347-46802(-) / protein_length=284 / sequence_SO=supercontig / SO=protein_coding / is_pseudo=false